MYLEKIEIPSFRVLRDVALEFGGVYDPQVFPLGSENGGGKSTTLQLIFTLLHCNADPARLPYLKNLLATDSYPGGKEQKLIARLTIRIGEESHSVEFISLAGRFLEEHLKEDPPRSGFSTEAEIESCNKKIARSQSQIQELEEVASQDPERFLRMRSPRWNRERSRATEEVQALLDSDRKRIQQSIRSVQEELGRFTSDWERIRSLLVAHNHKYITTYFSSTQRGPEARALVCRVQGQSASETEELLLSISSKVFLLGPSSQQYLFLSKEVRKALLRTKQRTRSPSTLPLGESPQIEYLKKLDEAETVMAGFLAYDWLSVEPLVKLFLGARDEDFESVVKTGSYGDRYTTLLREVNGLLFGKQVRPLVGEPTRVLGVEFVCTDDSGAETPLSPEDLSQGELKRLMIYAWLRVNSVVDALVLIDEIETSFHPDWQIGIVRDLQAWGPNNQYILATHSYELCQALTPRHVRELRPRLLHGEETAVEAAEETGSQDE